MSELPRAVLKDILLWVETKKGSSVRKTDLVKALAAIGMSYDNLITIRHYAQRHNMTRAGVYARLNADPPTMECRMVDGIRLVFDD